MGQGDFDPNATTGGTGIITSSTPSFTGYPTYRAGEQAQVIPIVTTTRATEAQLSAAYNKMSPVLRKALSQQLKDAGYKVPVTGEYSALVREKFLEANRDLSEEITTLSANDPKRLESVPYDLTTYLKDRKTDISKIQDGGPTTSRSTNIFTDAEAIAEVQKLYRTLLNAEPTPAEQARLAKRLQNAQKKNPTVTKYRTIGGVQDAITTGGLDPQEFLTNEIKKDPRYNEKQQEKLTTSRATLAATARANGLDLDKNFGSQVDDFLDRIKNGEDIKNIQNLIRQQGRLFLPESVRSAIDSSIDLSSALGIYVNDYAKSRGIPVDQIDINEVIPLAINDKGFASISDFRKAKKKQAWWADTPEADQEVFQGIRQVFSNFGIMEI
jgi:hypothetical protein